MAIFLTLIITVGLIGYFIGREVKADKIANDKGYRDFSQIPRHKYPPHVEPNGMIRTGGGWMSYYPANVKPGGPYPPPPGKKGEDK